MTTRSPGNRAIHRGKLFRALPGVIDLSIAVAGPANNHRLNLETASNLPMIILKNSVLKLITDTCLILETFLFKICILKYVLLTLSSSLVLRGTSN